jgi:uncharacterized protein
MRLSLVPQERRFYDLFKQQGRLVSDSLTELSKSLLEGRSRHPRLRDLEHACDDTTSRIYELVNRTFVTPIDREDILLLASRLDDIVDLAEEIADKMELYRIRHVADPAKAVGECLAAAGREIEQSLEHLEGFEGLDTPRAEVNRLEEEVDRITRDALGQLFADNGLSAQELIKWKDLYDLLENTMDTCDQVANVLQTISIKNA